MSTQAVRDTLTNENELLKAMIDFVNSYPGGGFTRQAAYIQKSWARFLGERHATNASLVKQGDEELKIDLDSELTQVGEYIKVTNADFGYSEQWSPFLKCEAEILQHLIGMCEEKQSK